jgi:hypothetical protein
MASSTISSVRATAAQCGIHRSSRVKTGHVMATRKSASAIGTKTALAT